MFALLGQAYNTKIEQIREKDKAKVITSARGRDGKGQIRAEATNDLLALLYANPTEKDRQLFKNRVTRGMRWYKMGQALGWGSFCLVPHDVISNTWLEHTLRVPELDIWLELVRKVNPDVVKAAYILDSWLGPDGIAGGAISDKAPLGIEAAPDLPIYEIEEVQDSEDSGDDSESVDPSQLYASPRERTRTPQLRQASLLELFHPIQLSRKQ